jgi:iron complex transport system permease protein
VSKLTPSSTLKAPSTLPITVLSALALVAIVLWALASGRVSVPLAGWQQWLMGVSPKAIPGFDVVAEVRLPRVLGAALIGAALSLAGLASQIALRNPLASPDLLGVSAGAGLAACVGLVLGLSGAIVSVMAFLGGIGATALTALLLAGIGRTAPRDPLLPAILIGLAVSSFCAAGIAALKWWADPMSKLPAITFWLLGGLSSVSWADVAALALSFVAGLAMLYHVRWRLGVLELGDDVAHTVGAQVSTLRWTALVAATLLTATTVAVAGLLGWLALIVPHAARRLLPQSAGRPWLLTGLLGAALMVLVDTLCRSMADTELPPGVVLALVGVPTFLWILRRTADV